MVAAPATITSPVPIALEHARLVGGLADTHRDPFDRLLAAQSLVEHMPLMTSDPVFKAFGVETVW